MIDNYTLFYYQFIKDSRITDEQYWTKLQDTPLYNTWCGLAFERVCLLHSRQIKKQLGINGVISNEYAWRLEADEEHPGTQIDLLIDRSDDVINLCEMKALPHHKCLLRRIADEETTVLHVRQNFQSHPSDHDNKQRPYQKLICRRDSMSSNGGRPVY